MSLTVSLDRDTAPPLLGRDLNPAKSALIAAISCLRLPVLIAKNANWMGNVCQVPEEGMMTPSRRSSVIPLSLRR